MDDTLTFCPTSTSHVSTDNTTAFTLLREISEERDVFIMADVKFSARAYCKMMLHAAKYPHCAINGILLAEEQKCKGDKMAKCLFICDAIPLFHHCLHVTPMAEIALTQVCYYLML